jgi:hypothetical protein
MQIISHSTPFSLHALMFASQLPSILVFLADYFLHLFTHSKRNIQNAHCACNCAQHTKMRIAHAIFSIVRRLGPPAQPSALLVRRPAFILLPYRAHITNI